jgi:hypothetical protein
VLVGVSELVFVSARVLCSGGEWALIYRFACCAMIGQLEFKYHMNWSSRSLALVSTRHTSVPLRQSIYLLLIQAVGNNRIRNPCCASSYADLLYGLRYVIQARG